MDIEMAVCEPSQATSARALTRDNSNPSLFLHEVPSALPSLGGLTRGLRDSGNPVMKRAASPDRQLAVGGEA